MGNEDQGCVAHFLIRALERQTITLKQVRDVLYVDDLVDAFLLTRADMPHIAGQASTSIEGAGAQATLDLATVLTGEYGRLIIAGYHQEGPQQMNMQLWNWRAIDVINAHERNPAASTDGMREPAALIERNALDPSILYTPGFAIDDLSKAFKVLERRPEGF